MFPVFLLLSVILRKLVWECVSEGGLHGWPVDPKCRDSTQKCLLHKWALVPCSPVEADVAPEVTLLPGHSATTCGRGPQALQSALGGSQWPQLEGSSDGVLLHPHAPLRSLGLPCRHWAAGLSPHQASPPLHSLGESGCLRQECAHQLPIYAHKLRTVLTFCDHWWEEHCMAHKVCGVEIPPSTVRSPGTALPLHARVLGGGLCAAVAEPRGQWMEWLMKPLCASWGLLQTRLAHPCCKRHLAFASWGIEDIGLFNLMRFCPCIIAYKLADLSRVLSYETLLKTRHCCLSLPLEFLLQQHGFCFLSRWVVYFTVSYAAVWPGLLALQTAACFLSTWQFTASPSRWKATPWFYRIPRSRRNVCAAAASHRAEWNSSALSPFRVWQWWGHHLGTSLTEGCHLQFMASSITRRGRCLQLIGRGQAWRRLQSQLYGPCLEVGHSMSADIPFERMGHVAARLLQTWWNGVVGICLGWGSGRRESSGQQATCHQFSGSTCFLVFPK